VLRLICWTWPASDELQQYLGRRPRWQLDMCGIAGVFSFSGAPIEERRIAAMCERLAHRGPDGAGLWLSPDGRVGLGHRRLSIIDLSNAAAQPMANEDGSVQVVFNGEIYNHAQIRRELETLGGHSWRTDHSDTEVIVHAYEQWGIDCLERFRGDFAIALWDGRERRLWLARDRVGVKPLYYAQLPNGIAFASEIKALFALPEVPRRLRAEALDNYLSFLTPPAPQTMFAGIEKLSAATRMCIGSGGAVRVERYWDPFAAARPLVGTSEAAVCEMLREELRSSVRYRKESDVPVGVFLSGGIDSSANAVLFAEGGGPVKTFSIGYDAQYASYADELPFAQATAHSIGAEHHVRRLTARDVTEFIEPMVYHQDEPIGDVVCVPLYYVAKLARDAGVIVCQVGEGSDELFCGYPFWRQHLRVARWNAWPVPRVLKRAGLAALAMAGQSRTYAYELLRRAAAGEPTFWGGAEGLTDSEKRAVLGSDARRALAGHFAADALQPIRERFAAAAWEPSAFNWMTYLDLNLRLPELLLARVDKMTMATSVEGRVPYLDHKLIELAFSIPTAMKVGDLELKRVLKRALRGLLPDEVIDRRKQGFGLPMREWLAGEFGAQLEQRVVRFARETGLFDPVGAQTLLRSATWSKAWLLYNFAVWHDRFITGTALPP
jgi:asparagine synthase (glutamine-hydrolysing)